MVSTYTPNIQLEEPARGDYVGTWDTPVNANMTLLDLVTGGITTISLNNSPVTLASAQYQCKQITFNSTLTGNVTITFPTSFKKSYEIQNVCTGSSAFVVTLQTTAAGGQAVGVPFGETIEVFNDGTNIKFKNLGRIGEYLDMAVSTVPAWITACTVPPYLNCNGTTFSSATYPQLTVILGGTTLPDARGRFRAVLNQTTTRLMSSNGGVDGNTILASGGRDSVTIKSSMLPSSIPYNDAGHYHGIADVAISGTGGAGTFRPWPSNAAGVTTTTNTVGITINPSTGATGTDGITAITPPAYIGGITMIRAA